ncbi:hypothetical protein GC096_08645 [Paenibacillus sp. LMG 31461]|uniref:Reverse transcriptase domain-containing protein n=1 Tax=Paenibacillus plantarum TaxID=2654975 RepID=A0ABX1X6N5_9BACL|nr:antiviral reverse transcriptase Drt5 [Paenibacillus plantarum]NOU64090.1 hypothetical protein [Paenibacillus plantarum]
MMELIDFIAEDNIKGLFPLNSNRFFLEKGEAELREYVYKDIFAEQTSAFASSPIVYALKDKFHLRKTHLLDPISTYFFYDFVLRNKLKFQKDRSSIERLNYGYYFNGDQPSNSYKEYHEFRMNKYLLKRKYKYFAKIDIMNCFNNFYHHDLASFATDYLGRQEGGYFGKFLREITGGRSINCFPQGIYPAKLFGNFFLSFLERARGLNSSAIIRYLDDVFLFSDSLVSLEQDVIYVQGLLGERGLFLNSEKTKFGWKQSDFDERKLDTLKKSLLTKRAMIRNYDDENHNEEIVLSSKETDYLKKIIYQKNVSEEDVELALSLLKDDKKETLQLVQLVISKYPNLIKNLYRFISDIDDNGEIWQEINNKIGSSTLQEFELFWISRIVMDHYSFDDLSADILLKIFQHKNSTTSVKSAILEFPELEYGFFEIKENVLRNEPGGIKAACALHGLRNLEKSKRNHIYKYTGKSSPAMRLYSSICLKI